ncbi:hypothetical protein KBD13_00355 [Patescibacteria group bacterium]|nr:hypothetical protein [Patescibacteria group bacterium]
MESPLDNPFLLWQVRLWIVFGNFLLLGLFLGIGWLIDRALGTGPKIMITALVLSFPVNQLIMITILKRRFLSKKPQA